MEDILDLDGGTLNGPEVLVDFEAWDSLAVLSFTLLAERLKHSVSASHARNAQTVDDLYALVSDKPAGSEHA